MSKMVTALTDRWDEDDISSDVGRDKPGRFIRLPGRVIRFIALEKVVLMFLDLLSPSFKLISNGIFRVTRDSEMEIDEEAEDLVRTFESALKRRRRGSVVRLTVDDAISDELLNFISAM